MPRLVALLPLLLLLSACPGAANNFSMPQRDAEADPPDAVVDLPVKVVTWNVKNLYNDVRDSPEVSLENEIIPSASEYQSKLAGIVTALAGLMPDVMVLEEVENEAVVADLASALLSAGVGDYPTRFVTQGNDPRGIDIAVLCKAKFAGQEASVQFGPSHAQELFESSTAPGVFHKFARDVAETHVSVGGRHLAFLGIHLKARDGDPESDHKRLAEAEQVSKIAHGITMQDSSASLIVLGDFNDVPGSPPLEALRLGDPPLVSLTGDLPAAERYSVTYGGNPQLFDDQIADAKTTLLVDPTSVWIVHQGVVNSVSDHDPVAVTYLLR